MFEPDAESISPEALAVLQRDRLRSLIDRLIAAGGVQGSRLRGRSCHRRHGARWHAVPAAHEIELTLRNELGLGVRASVLPAGRVPRSDVGKAVRVARRGAGEPPLPGLDD